MTANQTNKKPGQSADFMTLQDLACLCLAKWKWFVLSLAVALCIAIVYILRTPPVYTRSASVLIKEDSKGNSISSEMNVFSDLGLFQSGTNVNNEIIAFSSPALMAEVVKRLNLDISYLAPGRFHKEVAYGQSLPVTVTIEGLADNESAGFVLRLKEGSAAVLEDFTRNGEKTGGGNVSGNMNDTIITPAGKIKIEPTPFYNSAEQYTLHISRSTMHRAVEMYCTNLSVSLKNEDATVINLTFKDNSIQRAEDVLNTLIAAYNENWIKDKNRIATSTSAFINERLAVIERELGSVDEDISSYKSEHLLPDVQAASSLYMEQSSENNAQILALSNQLYMARYIRDYMAGGSNETQLLPANSGIGSSNIEQQIAEYNRLLLQRNSLVANSSTNNPLVADMDRSLAGMREALNTSIENQIVAINTQIESLQRTEKQTMSRIADNPEQAKYLLSVGRQQKVKEALYLFLLQKREENELSQAFTAYNTRVITPPTGQMIPATPVRSKILLVAFVLGLFVPVTVIFIRENTNTTVRGRKDLENLSVPLIGEIPLMQGSGKAPAGVLKKKKTTERKEIVVKAGNRDIINEAFRVVRTNLEFMAAGNNGPCVMAVTSFNPGSGKSFITINLAASLAIKEKRVLVIDGDMRNCSISAYADSPQKGLSDYLGGRAGELSELIVKGNQYKWLHILPVGTIPPNPTELLFSNRLPQIMESVKAEYDYIFIDCPPVEIVADTQIIEKQADRTIFIVRAGLLERSMLAELENIYNEKRLKNLSVILNGTETGTSRYGYHYGYGTGYHYGEK